MKEEKLPRYYLNGGDAFRLKLWIPIPDDDNQEQQLSTNDVDDNYYPPQLNTCDAV